MKENELLQQCLRLLRPEVARRYGQVFKHADAFTTGIPDVTVWLKGRVSAWEFKRLERRMVDTKLQRHIMKQLANDGHVARYVVYELDPERTSIVVPDDIADDGSLRGRLQSVEGWSPRFVVNYILAHHTYD